MVMEQLLNAELDLRQRIMSLMSRRMRRISVVLAATVALAAAAVATDAAADGYYGHRPYGGCHGSYYGHRPYGGYHGGYYDHRLCGGYPSGYYAHQLYGSYHGSACFLALWPYPRSRAICCDYLQRA